MARLLGYCYLLFLRKITITLFMYLIFFTTGSLIFYLVEKIMSLGYVENTYFNDMATEVYISTMTFMLTAFMLMSLKNLRWEIQSIYFYYFSAPNQDRGLNYLRLRTVLIKGIVTRDQSLGQGGEGHQADS